MYFALPSSPHRCPRKSPVTTIMAYLNDYGHAWSTFDNHKVFWPVQYYNVIACEKISCLRFELYCPTLVTVQ